VLLNVTSVSANGYLTVFAVPRDSSCALPPNVSNVNQRGSATANMAVVAVTYGDSLCVFSSDRAHVIVDIFGYV
jgi:hypothetical protein